MIEGLQGIIENVTTGKIGAWFNKFCLASEPERHQAQIALQTRLRDKYLSNLQAMMDHFMHGTLFNTQTCLSSWDMWVSEMKETIGEFSKRTKDAQTYMDFEGLCFLCGEETNRGVRDFYYLRVSVPSSERNELNKDAEKNKVTFYRLNEKEGWNW